MSSPISGSGSINLSAIVATGDLQTIIQMVQSERIRLLDQQLVDQVKAVEARNKQIAKLNDVLTRLNAYATQIEGTDPDDKPKAKDWTNEKIKQYEIPLNDAILAAGITDLGFKRRTGQRTPNKDERQDGSAGKLVTGTNIVTRHTTKSEIDTAITKVKGLIDAESNNQQMDMLRLQSLNNKKNESIEILTNTQKKHTDANTNIIRNI